MSTVSQKLDTQSSIWPYHTYGTTSLVFKHKNVITINLCFRLNLFINYLTYLGKPQPSRVKRSSLLSKPIGYRLVIELNIPVRDGLGRVVETWAGEAKQLSLPFADDAVDLVNLGRVDTGSALFYRPSFPRPS